MIFFLFLQGGAAFTKSYDFLKKKKKKKKAWVRKRAPEFI